MTTRAASFLLLALVAACGHHYRVNEAARNVPNVFLHDVKVTGGETKLVLRIEAAEACEVAVAPPGDAGAFRLHAGERILALTDVSGVEELPGRTGVEARSSRKLSLTFEGLPEGVRDFAAEGEIAGVGPVAFDVRLDAPSVVTCGW
ncbi:MAG TPA: hypothetical protein VFY93_04365 [Planctomycetota bacterium]|nr:hypothetical protein [Planctomycetota bacterium]